MLVRALYDHLPRHLVLFPVTERRLDRALDGAVSTMCRELLFAAEKPAPPPAGDEQPITRFQLQASTDLHVSELLRALR